MNQQTYINNQEIIRRRIEKKYLPLVASAIQSQIDIAVHVIKNKGVMAAQGHFHGDIVNTRMSAVIKGLYQDAAVMALRKFKIDGAKALPKFISEVLRFLDKYLLIKVVLPISTTTIKDIDNVLKESLDKGWGLDETVANLKEKEIPKWRAKLIVRTETAAATNLSQTIAADQQPFEMEKQWIAIEDKRTRLSHGHLLGVDGQRVPLYEKYSNGLMYPGDKNGSAKEVCNCRCTQGFFAVRDLEGNLVMKTKKDISLLDLLNAA